MITDKCLSANIDKFEAIGAEAPCAGRLLNTKQAVPERKRILLVEDQEALRTSFRMMLEFDGHQVTEATNGGEALDLFGKGEFDLVITDFEMPVMNGNELAFSIKLLAPSLPILMVTASERADNTVENPADVLLKKPLMVRDLRCALGKLLSARPDAAQSSALLV